MFKDLIKSLQEAFGQSSPRDFDTSDTPAEGPAQKPKGPPKSVPLKAMRNVQKPIPRRLPGVHAKPATQRDQFAAAKQAVGAPKHKYFESLIADMSGLLEGGGSRASKAGRQAALMKRQGFEATPARGLDDPEKKAAARDAHSASGGVDSLRIRAKAAKLSTPDHRNPYPAATRGPLGKLKLWPSNKSESVLGEGGGSRARKAMRQDKFYNKNPSDFANRAPDGGSFRHRTRSVNAMSNGDELADKTKEVSIFGRKVKLGPARSTVKVNGQIKKVPDHQKARDAVNDIDRNRKKPGVLPHKSNLPQD